MTRVALTAALRAELALMDVRRGALLAAIEALDGLDAPARQPRATTAPKTRAKGRAKTTATDDNIFAAVEAGADTKSALATATNLPDYNLSAGLKRLIAAKRVVATGATVNRRFTVRGAK